MIDFSFAQSTSTIVENQHLKDHNPMPKDGVGDHASYGTTDSTNGVGDHSSPPGPNKDGIHCSPKLNGTDDGGFCSGDG